MASSDPMARAKERITDEHPVQIVKRPKAGKIIKVPGRPRSRKRG